MLIDPIIREKLLKVKCCNFHLHAPINYDIRDEYEALLEIVLDDYDIDFKKIKLFFKNSTPVICDSIEKTDIKMQHSDFKYQSYKFNLICKEKEITYREVLLEIMENYYPNFNELIVDFIEDSPKIANRSIYKLCKDIYVYITSGISIIFHIDVIKKFYDTSII